MHVECIWPANAAKFAEGFSYLTGGLLSGLFLNSFLASHLLRHGFLS